MKQDQIVGSSKGNSPVNSSEHPRAADGSGEGHPLTPRQLDILQHSLGVDQYGQGEMYRNRFCAGGDDEDVCRELVALGYIQQHRTTDWLPYFNCSVTEAGKQAVREQSPKPPKLTRSQIRYREFLKSGWDRSFREWLGWRTKKARQERNEYLSEVRP